MTTLWSLRTKPVSPALFLVTRHHGNEYGMNIEKVSRDLHHPEWFSLHENDGAHQHLPHSCTISLCHLKASKNLTQRKGKQSSEDVVCTVALTKKHEPKGERKLLNSGEMTPSPTTAVDSLKVGTIAFRIYTSRESRGLERHGKKGHAGICCHHGSTGTASRHQKHLHSQLCLPSFNDSQQDFCLQTVSH